MEHAEDQSVIEMTLDFILDMTDVLLHFSEVAIQNVLVDRHHTGEDLDETFLLDLFLFQPSLQSAAIVRGALEMDPARHRVTWQGQPVSLTVTEFLILEALATRPGVIKSRNQLMDAAYSDDVFVDDRTIDSHIKRLRRKFRVVDPDFAAIATLYGAGYSFGDA